MITETITKKSTYLEQNYDQLKKTIKKKNKYSSLTAKKASLKWNPARERNKEYNNEMMNIRSNQDEDEDEDEEMTLDSEPSTPDQPKANNASKIFSVIDSVEEIEAT